MHGPLRVKNWDQLSNLHIGLVFLPILLIFIPVNCSFKTRLKPVQAVLHYFELIELRLEHNVLYLILQILFLRLEKK